MEKIIKCEFQITYCMHGLSEKNIEYIKEFPENSLVFFDDGLASLYKYKEFLKNYKKVNFIIAINPYIVLNAPKNPDINEITCVEAHNQIKIFKNFNHYLNLDMIRELSKYCEIADHTWDHFLKPLPKNLKKQLGLIQGLIINDLNFYKENLPEIFKKFQEEGMKIVWPYNHEIDLYRAYFNKIAKKDYGITKINYYGKERLSGLWNSYYEK